MDNFLARVLGVRRLSAIGLQFEQFDRLLLPSLLDGSFSVRSRLLAAPASGQPATISAELPLRYILEHVARSLDKKPPLSSPLMALFVLRAAHRQMSTTM